MHIISIFRKGRRKNGFKLYLAFRRVYFVEFLSFTGERHSVESGWRHCYLLSKDSVPLFPRSLANLAWISCQCLSKNWRFFLRASEPRVFWHQVSTSFHDDLRPKNWKSFFQFPLTKRLRPIIWLLPPPPLPPSSSSSTSSGHATLFGLLQWPTFPSLSNQLGVMECR